MILKTVVNEGTQVFFEDVVKDLGLSIKLGVISGAQKELRPAQPEKLMPEIADEEWVPA